MWNIKSWFVVQLNQEIKYLGYGVLSFAKNMGKNISKSISESLSGKFSQRRFDYAKRSAADATKTASKN